jgi:Ser-tRNA(Ala) deacylase AlaX
VYHYGNFAKSEMKFDIDDMVTMKIEKDFRIQNMRLHSGGHLLDAAVRNIGYNKWIGLVDLLKSHI